MPSPLWQLDSALLWRLLCLLDVPSLARLDTAASCRVLRRNVLGFYSGNKCVPSFNAHTYASLQELRWLALRGVQAAGFACAPDLHRRYLQAELDTRHANGLASLGHRNSTRPRQLKRTDLLSPFAFVCALRDLALVRLLLRGSPVNPNMREWYPPLFKRPLLRIDPRSRLPSRSIKHAGAGAGAEAEAGEGTDEWCVEKSGGDACSDSGSDSDSQWGGGQAACGSYCPPLHFAAFMGHADVVYELLQAGAYVGSGSGSGSGPGSGSGDDRSAGALHYACAGACSPLVVRQLLAAGADPMDRCAAWDLAPHADARYGLWAVSLACSENRGSGEEEEEGEWNGGQGRTQSDQLRTVLLLVQAGVAAALHAMAAETAEALPGAILQGGGVEGSGETGDEVGLADIDIAGGPWGAGGSGCGGWGVLVERQEAREVLLRLRDLAGLAEGSGSCDDDGGGSCGGAGGGQTLQQLQRELAACLPAELTGHDLTD